MFHFCILKSASQQEDLALGVESEKTKLDTDRVHLK